MQHLLEAIAFNVESCQIIASAGAQRIELCDNPGEGGTTPSAGMIRQSRKLTNIDLFPIIRPRGGHFFYTENEFEAMQHDILLCKKYGCDGIVTGILLKDGNVDTARTSTLVEIAYPMEVTFHRAFDRTPDPFKALEDVIQCGCTRILSSGQQPTAPEGAECLRQLIDQADDRIVIMPGSGIRSNNIAGLVHATGATEFHTSARYQAKGQMAYFNANLHDRDEITMVDGQELTSIVQILQGL